MFEMDMKGTKKRFFEDMLNRSGSTIIVNRAETKVIIKQFKDDGVIGEDHFEVYVPIEVPIKVLDTFIYNGQEYLIKVANVWEGIYTRCSVNPLYQSINVKYNGYPTWQFKVCPVDESVTINDSSINITYNKMSSIIFLKRDDISKQIQRGTRFFLYGAVYKIYGITYANSSILKLYCEADSISSLDDVENEVADNSALNSNEEIYTITATSGANGFINPNGATRVKHGSSKTFVFTSSNGYTLDKVFVDNQEEQISNNQYTFKNVVANHTINVTFKEMPISTYSITSSVNGNGSINPLGETLLLEGQSQAYNIAPNEEHKVSNVLVDGLEVQLIDNTYTFENVRDNHTITASFIALQNYNPRFKANYNGTLRINDETIGEGETVAVAIAEGQEAVLKIIPNRGYRLREVKISNTDYTSEVINNQLVITDDMAEMAEYYPLTVSFEAITYYTITASSKGNCSITPNGSVQVEEGQSQSYSITIEDGEIAIVKVDEAEVQLEGNTYIFNNVRANHSIKVATINTPSYELKSTTSYVGADYLKSGADNYVKLYLGEELVDASTITNTTWLFIYKGIEYTDACNDVMLFSKGKNSCGIYVEKTVSYDTKITMTAIVDDVTITKEFTVRNT